MLNRKINKYHMIDNMNCFGFAISEFTHVNLGDTPVDMLNNWPKPSYKELTRGKLESFLARNPNYGVKLINSEEELRSDEELVLFRLQTYREDENETHPDEIYPLYDFHVIRKHNDAYYFTYADDSYFYKSNTPQWLSKYDGPIQLLACNKVEEFADFILKYQNE